MKALTRIIALFSLCVLFSGCPYESEVSIDKPSVKVNSKLLGKWDDINNEGDQYVVSMKDEFTYSIEATTSKKKETDKYLAFFSIIDKTTFINLSKIEPGKSPLSYSLFKIEIKNENAVSLSEVTENIDEKFSSSEELKKFIIANLNNSYFFGNIPMELIRAKK